MTSVAACAEKTKFAQGSMQLTVASDGGGNTHG